MSRWRLMVVRNLKWWRSKAWALSPRMSSRFSGSAFWRGLQPQPTSHDLTISSTTRKGRTPTIMGKDKNAGGKSAGKKGKGGGDDSKDAGGATKVKGAQSINVRHILVSLSPTDVTCLGQLAKPRSARNTRKRKRRWLRSARGSSSTRWRASSPRTRRGRAGHLGGSLVAVLIRSLRRLRLGLRRARRGVRVSVRRRQGLGIISSW
jgi:hypothetical protein